MEQQNALATYGGVFDHVDIDSYDIKTKAGIETFIGDLMPLLHEYQQGYHAKHQIAKLYLNSRDGWSNEAREVNKQIIEQLDISKGYLSKVQAVMDFRTRKLPDNAELLAFFDGHPVTVQYYMTRLTAHQIEDQMLWGRQLTRSFCEAKVSGETLASQSSSPRSSSRHKTCSRSTRTSDTWEIQRLLLCTTASPAKLRSWQLQCRSLMTSSTETASGLAQYVSCSS